MYVSQRLWLPLLALVLGIGVGFYWGQQSNSVSTAPTNSSQNPLVTTSAIAIADEPLRTDYVEDAPRHLPITVSSSGYLARLELNSPEEIEQALIRAEALHKQLSTSAEGASIDPLALVIHGPEVKVFFGENYAQYKSIVDTAARLSAFNIVDVKVCKTQIEHITQEQPSLPPFIEEVPYGPKEVERLVKNEGYVYF